MTYEQYELKVQEYLKQELKNTFNREIKVVHQGNLLTPTKRSYNIDLSYRFEIANIEYLTIIECKLWKTTITRDIVLILKAKAQELCAHKSILVTSKGFQSGAIECAKENGIGLIKMMTSGRTEVFSNFIGTDFPSLLKELTKETEISEEEVITENIGVIFPLVSVEEYLKKKFGQELIEALIEYKNKMDGFDVSKLKKQTLDIIKSIPFNWHKEYQDIETCGLPIKLFNENELRFFNLFIVFAKSSIKN